MTDDVAGQKHIWLVNSGVWTFYGILSVLRYLNTGDEFFYTNIKAIFRIFLIDFLDFQ
jgi:hypothetical protein